MRLGATRDGVIRALDVYTLSNTGAYGEHGPTTVGLSGHKSIPPLHREPGGLPLRLRRGVHQPAVRRGLPGLRGHPGHLRRGVGGERAGRPAGHGPGGPPGEEHGPGGADHARLLQRARQRLRPGQVHGAVQGALRLGGEVPRPGHGQREGAGRRRGHGHAGLRHLRGGRGLGHHQAQRRGVL